MPSRHRTRLATIHPLIPLCLAFTLLVVMHTVVTPLFEAPDEVWHYAYVRWLAEGNGLPPLDEDLSGAYQEAAQPPLYYLVAAWISAPFDDRNLQDLTWGNPGFGYQAPGTVPDNKNMLIHTRSEALPWEGAALAIHATRFTSWAFGILTVVAAWGLGYESFRSRRYALVTAALVAFQPQFVFLSGVVSNDSAAAAIATAALWLGARIVNRGVTRRRTILAGIISALAMLTKTSTLLVTPVLTICLILGTVWRRAHPRAYVPLSSAIVDTDNLQDRLQANEDSYLRRYDESVALQGSVEPRSQGNVYPAPFPWRRAAAHLALQLSIAATAGGWWYLRNAILYGDPLGLGSHTETLWGRVKPATLIELIPELPLVLRSFWAAYGWGHVTWPDWVYGILWVITLPLLALAIGATVRIWLRTLKDTGGPGKLLTKAPSVGPWEIPAAMATGWLAGIAIALVRWMQQVQAPHGRLLFPAIGAWALLLTLGIRRIRLSHSRIGHRYQMGLLTVSIILTASAPGAQILPTFAPPRLRTPDAIVDACTNPVDLQYGDWARLICAEATPARVTPGDEVTITACWESLSSTADNLTVFAHLIGPETARPAERHTYPGLGRYPTSLWVPGTAFCDTFAMTVAEWAEAPVRYRLEVGLFDTQSNDRLTAMAPDGNPVEPPLVAAVDVVPPQPEGLQTNAIPDSKLATFGGAPGLAYLVSAEVPAEAAAGNDITITLHWRALATADLGYIAFIHLWEPGTDAPLAQDDAQPRDGWFPTTAWADGDSIPDQHTLHLPKDLAPGSYPLWAGLYNPVSADRVPAYGTQGRFEFDMVPLGEITIGSYP